MISGFSRAASGVGSESQLLVPYAPIRISASTVVGEPRDGEERTRYPCPSAQRGVVEVAGVDLGLVAVRVEDE